MKIKGLIIIGSLLLLIGLFIIKFPDTDARFASSVSSNVIGSVAFYVVDLETQNVEINLDKLVPSDEEYEYNFTISNYKDEKHLETNAEYDLVIRTTTNLPLEYKLYMNDKNEDIIISSEQVQDNNGTYFNIMKVNKEYFRYDETKTNNYNLIIKFPKEYSSFNYQDIIESIEIILKSNQIVD